MGVMDRFRRGGGSSASTMTLNEKFMEDYNFEYVSDEPGNQYAIVSPKAAPGKVATRRAGLLTHEYGTSSPSPWTSFTRDEYNPSMRGLRGMETYDKMRRSDGGVRSTLRAAKTPVLAARYFVQPGGTKAIDKKAADWVAYNLFERMSTPWAQTLTEALLMLDFGYYCFEKVWVNEVVPGWGFRTVLKKLGPRHPMDIKSWLFDANGGPAAATFYPSDLFDPTNQDIIIPIQKLLVFSFDKEAGNIEGISILRSAYKHWYYKEQLYKIDAIQKERHGIGIPVIVLPLGFTKDDKTTAENLGRNIRTNERAHIVLPPGWALSMLKLEGQPVDCLKSIDHHDTMIRMNVLGEFLGTAGAKEEDQTMFLKATRFVADIITDTFNAYQIPEMVRYNFADAAIPKLRARRIGEQEDQRTTSFTVRNMVGAGVIVPDDVLEDAVRDMLDLPARDEDTARPQTGADLAQLNADLDKEAADEAAKRGATDEASTRRRPNAGGEADGGNASARGARVGLPRQAAAGNQRKGSSGRAGRDRSGGK